MSRYLKNLPPFLVGRFRGLSAEKNWEKVTLKGINSKLEIIYSQKETLESRFLEVEAQKKIEKRKLSPSLR